MLRRIKRLYYKLTTSKDKIIQNKLKKIMEVTENIVRTSAEEKIIATPSGDFLLVVGPLLIPILMVQSDTLGLDYTVVFNSQMELTTNTAVLSRILKQQLNVVKEMTVELAFDTINKRILIGDSASQYNKADAGQPTLTVVN